MHDFIEYNDNYSKAFGILCQYCRDEPGLAADNTITDFTEANSDTTTFKMKEKTGKRGINETKNVEIMVLLKQIINSWRTLEMSLINCEINLDLNWYKKCVIVATNAAAQDTTF